MPYGGASPCFAKMSTAPSETTARALVLRAVEEMPGEPTFEEITERVYMVQKIERGRQQIDAGEGISHDDARRQMKRWHG